MSVVLQGKCSDKEESLSSLSRWEKKRSLGGGCGMTEWTESTNEKHTTDTAEESGGHWSLGRLPCYDAQITLGWVTPSTVATGTLAHRGSAF